MSSLSRIAARHGMPLWRALPYEAFVRCYQRPLLRRILQLPFRRKSPQAWIFMGGSYNAGTTIVKNALMAHPDVCGMPVEGDVLSSAFSDLELGGFPRGMFANQSCIESERASGVLDSELVSRDWSPWIRSDRTFLDKSIANTVRIPLLRKAFPGSRFVMIVRDPHDVARGIRKRSQPASGGEYADEFLDRQWRYFYSCIEEDATDDTLLCSYEAFIQSPLRETKRLYEALGLSPVAMKMEGQRLTIGSTALNIRPMQDERERPTDAWSQLRSGLELVSSRIGTEAASEQR